MNRRLGRGMAALLPSVTQKGTLMSSLFFLENLNAIQKAKSLLHLQANFSFPFSNSTWVWVREVKAGKGRNIKVERNDNMHLSFCKRRLKCLDSIKKITHTKNRKISNRMKKGRSIDDNSEMTNARIIWQRFWSSHSKKFQWQ